MKIIIALSVLLLVYILTFGSPLVDRRVEPQHYYSSPEAILPMTFAHADHQSVVCVECHHNFVDDTGSTGCLYCHVNTPDVRPLLEQQFHDLCRGCHVELAKQGKDSGPLRQCRSCHVEDAVP